MVSATDPTNHAIKVRVQPEDIETGWMPDLSGVQAGKLRIACPTSVGTHVVLLPIEGDAEQFVVVAAVYDTVVVPPKVPREDRTVRTGEWLVRSGYESVASKQKEVLSEGDVAGGWCFVAPSEVSFGVGNNSISVSADGVKFNVGNVEASIDNSGISVKGGDVYTQRVSLDQHIHAVGTQQTSRPLL
ncbi:baseplate assembly protein [Neokomagataea tanensis]|uniref:Baseplate assembly protein n=1 Tax=Neokomagataea tanensis TaxID=661191 RepID=A0A4Y6VBI0_9PROT|nr:baseplate assembly protein [Neokomagataea tanensis]